MYNARCTFYIACGTISNGKQELVPGLLMLRKELIESKASEFRPCPARSAVDEYRLIVPSEGEPTGSSVCSGLTQIEPCHGCDVF